MSRARNYGFDRRRRDDLRRAKQEAKRARKNDRAEPGAGPEIGEAQETGTEPGVWEWFSASRGRTATSPAGSRPPSDPPDDWILLTDVAEDEQPPAP